MTTKPTYQLNFRAALMSGVGALAVIGLAAPGAFAQTAAPAAASSSATAAETSQSVMPEVIVTGAKSVAGGLMKVQTASEAMSSVTASAIQEKIAAASPLQLISTLPGVNFGSTDGFGLSIRNLLNVRGLDETEIGFMFEGIPGDDYFNYFPYTESWADNENISDITLTPGNSRLQDPILTASGGELIELVRNPRNTFGGMASESVGSYDGWRTFEDIDTGPIGQTGAKAFLSYSHTSANNYVGAGTNTRDHIDTKVVEDWSSTIHSSLFLSYNGWTNDRLPFLTLAQADKGLATNNFAQFAYVGNFTPGTATPNYYKALEVKKTNVYLSSTTDFDLSNTVTLHITPYYIYKLADYPGESLLSPSSIYSGNQLVTAAFDPSFLQGGKLVAQNNAWNQQYQLGINSMLEADLTPSNHLVVGYWHENFRIGNDSYYNLIASNGDIDGTSLSTALKTTSGAIIAGTHYTADSTTNEFYIGDTQSLLDDKLKVSVGFKELIWSVQAVNEVIGATPLVQANWNEALPRILVSYDLNPKSQLYANITTNARMPLIASTYFTDYSTTTGAVSQAANASQKPEYNISAQVGYRYHGPLIIDVNAFYMHLLNHQLSSLQNINNTLVPLAFTVGNETIRGASIEASTRSYAGFSLYGSGQYLDGTFDNNTPVSGTYLPTKGKQMVESPTWVASFGARYDHGPIFAELTEKYVGSQYTSFMNDQGMPAYETTDLSFGYRLPDYKAFSKPVARVSMTNLGNKSYISADATIVTNAVATTALNGKTIAAGTPNYYVGAPLTVMFTLSSNF